VRFTPWQLCPRGNISRYTFYRRLGGRRAGRSARKGRKIPRLCRKSNPDSSVFQPLVCSKDTHLMLSESTMNQRLQIWKPDPNSLSNGTASKYTIRYWHEDASPSFSDVNLYVIIRKYILLYFQHVYGIHTPAGNSNNFTHDFYFVRLPTQDMTYLRS
jgi:hypothetical protein